LLYAQIKSIEEENKFLKSLIEKMKIKWDEELKDLNEKL
jgi:hypothetical protein